MAPSPLVGSSSLPCCWFFTPPWHGFLKHPLVGNRPLTVLQASPWWFLERLARVPHTSPAFLQASHSSLSSLPWRFIQPAPGEPKPLLAGGTALAAVILQSRFSQHPLVSSPVLHAAFPRHSSSGRTLVIFFRLIGWPLITTHPRSSNCTTVYPTYHYSFPPIAHLESGLYHTYTSQCAHLTRN